MNSVILLKYLIAVACSYYIYGDKCEQYLNACYNEGMKTNWSQKYKVEYRKSVVLESCRRKGGFTIK